MDDRTAYIALNMMDGVGPVTVRVLAQALGSAAAIMTAPAHALEAVPGAGQAVVARILAQRESVEPERELDAAVALGAAIITQADSEYPEQLRQIHDPPLALYVRGRLEAADKRAISVVGTRHATVYGRETAERLSYRLAMVGFTVVSGLARGIDTAAHRGAIKARGRTLTVLGSALDKLYPPENRALADEIAAAGAVLSEFPLGREPDRTTFPMRNRVISGLCMGILVVEAGLGSGALITVNQALDQGRAVFAVPGRIDSPASRGAHQLIKNGARLVEDIEDILQEFEYLFPPSKHESVPASPRPGLAPEEEKIVSVLREGETDLDSLARQTGLGASRIGSLLLGLEMKRVVRMLPGRRVGLADPRFARGERNEQESGDR